MLADLNERFETSYDLNEIWGSTTVKNRFGYFKGHLSSIDGVITDTKSIRIDPQMHQEILKLVT